MKLPKVRYTKEWTEEEPEEFELGENLEDFPIAIDFLHVGYENGILLTPEEAIQLGKQLVELGARSLYERAK